jgi:hypothetical protein
MLVIPINKVVDRKRIKEEEERHKGLLTPKKVSRDRCYD